MESKKQKRGNMTTLNNFPHLIKAVKNATSATQESLKLPKFLRKQKDDSGESIANQPSADATAMDEEMFHDEMQKRLETASEAECLLELSGPMTPEQVKKRLCSR